MSQASSRKRTSSMNRVLATARSNPEFALRLAQNMPKQLKLPFTNEVLHASDAESKQVATVSLEASAHSGTRGAVQKAARAARPGVRKCDAGATNGYTAQLNAFARMVAGTRR